MTKRNRLLKIDDETLIRLRKRSREVSHLEDKDIPMGEIVERMAKDREIEERLKIGARQRRRLLR